MLGLSKHHVVEYTTPLTSDKVWHSYPVTFKTKRALREHLSDKRVLSRATTVRTRLVLTWQSSQLEER